MWWRKRRRVEEDIHGIREELRAIRELLERLLLQQPSAPPSENRSVASSASDAELLPPDRSTTPTALTASTPVPTLRIRPSETQMVQQLEQLLRARQLQLSRYLVVQPRGPLDEEMYHLGFFMSQHYALVAHFLAELRATLAQPYTICFPLHNCSEEELTALTNVATRLYRLRILHYYLYDRAHGQIRACVDRQPESRNYLAGAWFEMGVFEAVRRWRKTQTEIHALLLRDAQLNGSGGGSCELDILIYLPNHLRRLILLECKSASNLKSEDIQQVRRAATLLNLGIRQAAVVMPEPPPDHLIDGWVQQTGASIIGFQEIERFLTQAIS
jgi:hypothetical protein